MGRQRLKRLRKKCCGALRKGGAFSPPQSAPLHIQQFVVRASARLKPRPSEALNSVFPQPLKPMEGKAARGTTEVVPWSFSTFLNWGATFRTRARHRFVSGHGFTAVPRQCLELAGFSPCRLLFCQIGEAIRKLLRRIRQARLHGVPCNVVPISQKALSVVDPHLRKSALPDLPRYPNSFLNRKENPPLMNCMALSIVMSPPTLISRCRWSGITMKSWSWNLRAAT